MEWVTRRKNSFVTIVVPQLVLPEAQRAKARLPETSTPSWVPSAANAASRVVVVAAMAVEVNFRPFQFNDGPDLGTPRLLEKAQDRIRRFIGTRCCKLSLYFYVLNNNSRT